VQRSDSTHFESVIQPHLGAAYNFARWIVRNHHDAEDVVQESLVKAFRAADTFHGTDVRPWLFAIVRNSAINFLKRDKCKDVAVGEAIMEPIDPSPNPEMSLLEQRRRDRVRSAIGRLPFEFREALLLREMEGLAYKEIASVLKVPMGTVMSRLSRARQLLVEELITAKELGL
jgi:RNA polymerase sigma-70 factor (ECF subfamily)